MQGKHLVSGLCLWVLAAAGASAQTPIHLQTSVFGYTDVNGNGTLDCGEPIEFSVSVSSPTAILTEAETYSGTLSFPSAGETGLVFVPGSVKVHPELGAGCAGSAVSGNGPEDLSAVVDFACQVAHPGIIPAFTVTYEAVFANEASPSYVATAHAHVVPATGAAFDLDAASQEAPPPSGACTGAPNQVVVAKTERGTASPGATIVYGITATDTSGLGDGGVQLTEVVPEHTTFAPAASDPGWVCPSPAAGSLCRLPAGNIVPNGSIVHYFAVTVDSPLPAGVSSLTNTACVRGGPTSVLGCGSATTPTAGTAAAKMAKTVKSGSGAPGTTLVYQLTVSDAGNEGLGASTILETVPANTTFDAGASDAGWSCAAPAAGSSCTLAVAGVPAGGSQSALFAVDVAPTLPAGTTAIGNTACVNTGSTLDCNTATTPTTGAPALSLHKSVAGQAVPGATLTYTIAVQNTGSEGAANVTVTETVPANTTFAASGSAPGWSCSPGPAAGSVCTLAIATLAAGATANLAFAVTVASPLPADATTIGNTACAALPAPQVEAPAASACDTVTVPTAGAANLALSKSYGGGPVLPSAILTFGLRVANTGNQDAGPVTLTETVPLHSTFAPTESSPGWTCSPGPAAGSGCTLALPGLPAGSSAAAVFAVQADAALPAAAVIANAACASASAGGQTAAGCATASTPPALALATTLAVALAKDADASGGPTPGDTLRYTLLVPNPSGSVLQALVSRLDLDPHETLVAGSVQTDHGTVASGNGAADTTVAVNVGDLPAGQTATIVFETTIKPLPVGTTEVTAQAETSGANVPTDASSDPATPQIPHNPTSIAVTVLATPVRSVPTLDGWGLATLGGCLLLGGVRFLRSWRPGA